MTKINLGKQISSGGEGILYEVVGQPNDVYKKFKPFKLTRPLQEKLEYMWKNPPKMLTDNEISWPSFLAKTPSGDLDGFMMPRLTFNMKLNDVYERQYYPYEFSVIVASNLCAFVHDVHENNITVGDFNHENLGVDDETSFVSMMDCDSFHLAGGRYPCIVCMAGYAAPELLKRMRGNNTTRYEGAPFTTFTQNTDLWTLAVHIFRLLMNGVSPYNGVDTTVRTSSAVVTAGDEPIRKGMYVFKQGLEPFDPACPPHYVLTDRLMKMFDTAFIHGEPDIDYRENTITRPQALEWYDALMEYQSQLTNCRNKMHQYYNRLSNCPWCEAEEREQAWTRNRYSVPAYRVRRK